MIPPIPVLLVADGARKLEPDIYIVLNIVYPRLFFILGGALNLCVVLHLNLESYRGIHSRSSVNSSVNSSVLELSESVAWLDSLHISICFELELLFNFIHFLSQQNIWLVCLCVSITNFTLTLDSNIPVIFQGKSVF
jgi:hypothetical protein